MYKRQLHDLCLLTITILVSHSCTQRVETAVVVSRITVCDGGSGIVRKEVAVFVQKSLDCKNLTQLFQSLTVAIVLGVIAAVAVRKGCGVGGKPFVLCDVRTSVYHSLPASLANADREAEGCGQQMVAKAV